MAYYPAIDSNSELTTSLCAGLFADKFNIDYEETKELLGRRMLTNSSTLATQVEHHFLNSVNQKINNYNSLSKIIYINQKLSDKEKKRLSDFWMPPYKLVFSNNPKDIGAHMYFRSLNEIATFRCYDLLNLEQESIPNNYDMLVKEVGASIVKLIKYKRTKVHACTPIMDLDDAIRNTNTCNSLANIIHCETDSIKVSMAKHFYNYSPLHRCQNLSQHCNIRAKYVVFAHSAYNCNSSVMADIMYAANAIKGVGFIHYSKTILSNLYSGSDNGLYWKVFIKNKITYIQFWFENDYQNSYVHELQTYLSVLKCTIITTSNRKQSYIIQRLEEIDGLLFFNVLKPQHNIPQCSIVRSIPYSDESKIIVHFYEMQTDPSEYFYHHLIPKRLVVPVKFFEKLYFYLITLPEGKFTVQNSVIMASTMANRVVVNGTHVSEPFEMSIDVVEKIAYATYFIAYCNKYDMSKTLHKLQNDIDMQRHPNFINKIKSIFSDFKQRLTGARFVDSIQEKNFDDVTTNLENTLHNEVKQKYSDNILQWIKRMFMCKGKYRVKFYPITRIVNLDEDVDIIKNLITNVPYSLDPMHKSLRDETMNVLREQLQLDLVNADEKEFVDCVCTETLVLVENTYINGKCVHYAVATALSTTVDNLEGKLLSSQHLDSLDYATRVSVTNQIKNGNSDMDLFKLIANEFNINICVHMDCNYHKILNVGSSLTYHFEITNGHCSYLRAKINYDTFSVDKNEFGDFRKIPEHKVISLLNQYLGKTMIQRKECKFNSFKYSIESNKNQKTYVCHSAYKLIEIVETYNILKGKIFDISAAPGSWLQVCRKYMPESPIFYSSYVDGLDMSIPIEIEKNCYNVNINNDGDLTDYNTILDIVKYFDETFEEKVNVDTLLCDAAVMTVDDVVDVVKMQKILTNTSRLVDSVLNNGGNVVIKTFCQIAPEYIGVSKHFSEVYMCKPHTSCKVSSEYYLILMNYKKDYVNDINYEELKNCANYVWYRNLYDSLNNSSANHIPFPFPIFYHYRAPTDAVKPKIVPEITPVSTTVQLPSAPTEKEILDEPVDSIHEHNTFNFVFQQHSRVLDFCECHEPGMVVMNTLEENIADVQIRITENKVPSIKPDGSMEYQDFSIDNNNMRLNVNLHHSNNLTTLSNISYILQTMSNLKLRYSINIMFLKDESLYPAIKSLLLNYPNNLYTIYTHVDINSDDGVEDKVFQYQQSIAEYMAYLEKLNSINLNAYQFYYRNFENHSFNLNQVIIANFINDAQNMSLLKGDKYLIRHDKCKPNYSHGYDGKTFVPISEIDPSKHYIVGDFTYRLFNDNIIHMLRNIDVNELTSVNFQLYQGVAGHGKTEEICTKHSAKLSKNTTPGDLVLTPTIAGKEVLIERTLKKKNLPKHMLDLSYYRTINSYVLKDTKLQSNIVYVDEVMMVHTAMILAIAYYSKAKMIYMYGDTCQIPSHSQIGDFKFSYNSPLSLFRITDVRNKSYRIPLDVASTLSEIYLERHRQFKFDKPLLTYSNHLRSLELVKICNVQEILSYYSDKFTVLVFTHTVESELSKLGIPSHTIASYQGNESDNIMIVRTSYSPADRIYADEHICVTALTRHKRKCIYYTTCDTDTLSGLIKNAIKCSDIKVKNSSANKNICGIGNQDTTALVCNYENGSSNKKLFQPTTKYVENSVTVDPLKFKTPLTFVYHCNSLKPKIIYIPTYASHKIDLGIYARLFKKHTNIRVIHYKVKQLSYVDDSVTTDLVNEYMVRNCISSHVNEHIVSEHRLEESPALYFQQELLVDPNIHDLQIFFNSLFPHQFGTNTNLDHWFVHNSDINYVLSNTTFSPIKDVTTYARYDKLRPTLYTCVPNVRECTQREIILGIQKRNLNPPELICNISHEESANDLMQSFVSKCLLPNSRKVLTNLNPIQPSTISILNWLYRQDRAVAKSLDSDIPFMVDKLNKCSLSLKRSPKIRITPDCLEEYSSVQTITYHHKVVNAYLCSVIDEVQKRCKEFLLPYIKFFTGYSNAEFGKLCYDSLNNFGKMFLFSGDDSYLYYKGNTKEMDMSKFDKSQLWFVVKFLRKILRFFGCSEFICEMYERMMVYRICTDISTKVTVTLTPQMESGSAITYFGNTVFCTAVIASCIDFDTLDYSSNFSKFSQKFNLEVKEFSYKLPYFCSKFVIVSPEYVKFLPDPVKILIKLGRKDLTNNVHRDEFHTSLLDLVSGYENMYDIEIVSKSIQERYNFPHSCVMHIRNLISVIKNKDEFNKLYYTCTNDMIDTKCINFSNNYS
ncbi:hypothetical protein [Hubei virga-like virus 7]|uniref:hypothetical protein n=1 Tax=Hubei virga-like virus 7 TaxID=1923340 RepID=UPI00090A682C|nr:hypothetical protein [Hubei virga-like virus 7]APG77671.1 hypothetical protein [Hubei virga-like virus 7]